MITGKNSLWTAALATGLILACNYLPNGDKKALPHKNTGNRVNIGSGADYVECVDVDYDRFVDFALYEDSADTIIGGADLLATLTAARDVSKYYDTTVQPMPEQVFDACNKALEAKLDLENMKE